MDQSLGTVAAGASGTRPRDRAGLRIGIVGAGFGGIGLAVLLKRAGFSALTVLERAATAGGKMREVEVGAARLDAGPDHLRFRTSASHVRLSVGATDENLMGSLQRTSWRMP